MKISFNLAINYIVRNFDIFLVFQVIPLDRCDDYRFLVANTRHGHVR